MGNNQIFPQIRKNKTFLEEKFIYCNCRNFFEKKDGRLFCLLCQQEICEDDKIQLFNREELRNYADSLQIDSSIFDILYEKCKSIPDAQITNDKLIDDLQAEPKGT